MRDRGDLVFERLHNPEGLTRPQAVVHEDDGYDGESVPLYSRGNRCCCLFRLKVLVCKIDDWAVHVFDEQVCARQTVRLLACLEVCESRVWRLFDLRVEVFELPVALVKVPELLLGAAPDQKALSFEIFLLSLLILQVHLVHV